MGATYTDIPLSVSTVFEGIVSEVETNLVSESSLNIDRVGYRNETWQSLCRQVSSEKGSEDHKDIVYPFIAVIRNYDEKYSYGNLQKGIRLTVVIVIDSDKDLTREEREATNYVNSLRPIKEELLAVMAKTKSIRGYTAATPTHTATEFVDLGTSSETGPTASKLPDCVDAIILDFPEIRFQKPVCTLPYDTPIVSVRYLNNIQSVYITNEDPFGLEVRLADSEYIDTDETEFGQSPVYELYMSHDNSTTQIDPLQTISFVFDPGFSQDCYGYISCGNAILRFLYSVTQGRALSYTINTQLQLRNFEDDAGLNYPNYSFEVIGYYTQTDATIDGASKTYDGGNVIPGSEITYDTQVSTDPAAVTTASLPLPQTPREVGYTVIINGESLENLAYYLTQ